jgi:hypothetical protein
VPTKDLPFRGSRRAFPLYRELPHPRCSGSTARLLLFPRLPIFRILLDVVYMVIRAGQFLVYGIQSGGRFHDKE